MARSRSPLGDLGKSGEWEGWQSMALQNLTSTTIIKPFPLILARATQKPGVSVVVDRAINPIIRWGDGVNRAEEAILHL